MSDVGRINYLKIVGGALLAGVMAIPAVGFASEATFDTAPAPQPAADMLVLDTSRLLADDVSLSPAIVPVQPIPAIAAGTADDSIDYAEIELDAELECMAKVVHHEAANQARRGQLAVAQLIMNRVESGRFPRTICGVTNQRGQFFDTASYNPRRDDKRWRTAVEVAAEARDGDAEHVVPKAMFYHAAYQAPTSWFRTRTRVTKLGDHIFYR